MIKREFLYDAVTTSNGNKELDFLGTSLSDMELTAVDYYRVTAATQYRPDLISLRYFGTFHLGWLLARYNGFLDPVEDFKIGVLIKIPSLKEYYQFFSRNAREV